MAVAKPLGGNELTEKNGTEQPEVKQTLVSALSGAQ
jgi:hypothetical protein